MTTARPATIGRVIVLVVSLALIASNASVVLAPPPTPILGSGPTDAGKEIFKRLEAFIGPNEEPFVLSDVEAMELTLYVKGRMQAEWRARITLTLLALVGAFLSLFSLRRERGLR